MSQNETIRSNNHQLGSYELNKYHSAALMIRETSMKMVQHLTKFKNEIKKP